MRHLPLLLCVLITKCCPAADRELPVTYDYRDDYVLKVASVEYGENRSTPSAPGTLRMQGVSIEANSENGQFDLRITNDGPHVVTVRFDQVRYIDETSVSHSIAILPASLEAPSCNPLRLKRGGSAYCSVVPAAKEYKVRESCFTDYVYREPLVPWSVTTIAPAIARTRVKEMASSGALVGLEIPLRVGIETDSLKIRARLAEHPLRGFVHPN